MIVELGGVCWRIRSGVRGLFVWDWVDLVEDSIGGCGDCPRALLRLTHPTSDGEDGGL